MIKFLGKVCCNRKWNDVLIIHTPFSLKLLSARLLVGKGWGEGVWPWCVGMGVAGAELGVAGVWLPLILCRAAGEVWLLVSPPPPPPGNGGVTVSGGLGVWERVGVVRGSESGRPTSCNAFVLALE